MGLSGNSGRTRPSTASNWAEDAGFDPDHISCHTFQATGITTYLENDGDLETAQHIAGHASANTTRIYDHWDQKVEQEEIEQVRI